MKPKIIKNILTSAINEVSAAPHFYARNPDKDFRRNRKLPFKNMLSGIIGMGGGTLSNEMLDFFGYSPKTATSSAFVQQREKIKPEAFETVFKIFNSKAGDHLRTEGLRLLAVDGSDIHIPTVPEDEASFYPGSNGQKPYNLLHLNVLYDLEHSIYVDSVLQKGLERNEHSALTGMVDRSAVKDALVIADRGYESYNNMAHIQEKGWKFLVRIRDGVHGIKRSLDLPESDTYDVPVVLSLTRKQTKETKELFKDRNNYRYMAHSSAFDYLPVRCRKTDEIKFYVLKFRIVRFKVSDGLYETVLTNLDSRTYPPSRLKKLYAMRWGVETSFRDLKYTIGLLNFHSKKVMCILQEIYARLIMYNFTEMVTSHVIIRQKTRKYIYKANFTIAAHMCRMFFCGKASSPDVEAIIARNTVPIRSERKRPREMQSKTFVGFLYRVA